MARPRARARPEAGNRWGRSPASCGCPLEPLQPVEPGLSTEERRSRGSGGRIQGTAGYNAPGLCDCASRPAERAFARRRGGEGLFEPIELLDPRSPCVAQLAAGGVLYVPQQASCLLRAGRAASHAYTRHGVVAPVCTRNVSVPRDRRASPHGPDASSCTHVAAEGRARSTSTVPSRPVPVSATRPPPRLSPPDHPGSGSNCR
jgi:hypothetical protein